MIGFCYRLRGFRRLQLDPFVMTNAFPGGASIEIPSDSHFRYNSSVPPLFFRGNNHGPYIAARDPSERFPSPTISRNSVREHGGPDLEFIQTSSKAFRRGTFARTIASRTSGTLQGIPLSPRFPRRDTKAKQRRRLSRESRCTVETPGPNPRISSSCRVIISPRCRPT